MVFFEFIEVEEGALTQPLLVFAPQFLQLPRPGALLLFALFLFYDLGNAGLPVSELKGLCDPGTQARVRILVQEGEIDRCHLPIAVQMHQVNAVTTVPHFLDGVAESSVLHHPAWILPPELLRPHTDAALNERDFLWTCPR